MVDIDKLIDGLECCQKNKCSGEAVCPIMCGKSCVGGLIRDALEIVKPRVLTLEEADDADVCWLEVSGVERMPPCRVAYYAPTGTCTIRRMIAADEDVPAAEYGKTWRAWSARPTDEQREATPW